MLTKVLEREKRQLLKENLVKRESPQNYMEFPFSTPAKQQQRRKMERSCHTARGHRVLLGKWHGRASWRGAPVPNFWLLPGLASRGTVYSFCLASPASPDMPFWVGFSSKITFGLLFGHITILPTKYSIKLISLN